MKVKTEIGFWLWKKATDSTISKEWIIYELSHQNVRIVFHDSNTKNTSNSQRNKVPGIGVGARGGIAY